jgi:hypothetical protein
MQRKFRRKFGDDLQRGAAPSRKIIGQWHETGSVQVKARTHRNNGWSPENIQHMRIALERNPHRSVWRQVYLGDGSNAVIVMEDISKTLY